LDSSLGLKNKPETPVKQTLRHEKKKRNCRCLDGVLSSPFSSHSLVFWPVGLIYVGNLWDERIVGVGVRQHRTNREEHYDTRTVSSDSGPLRLCMFGEAYPSRL